MRGLVLLSIMFCGLRGAFAVTHSWKAFYTASTGLSEFPEFVAVNIVDDEPVGYFDSRTSSFQYRQKWMEENLGPEYLKQQTDVLKRNMARLKANVGIAMERFNQSGGVHTAQRMYGCEWDNETGATGGFRQDGYDGKDFITYDMENQRFIGPTPQAFITAHKLNNNPALLESLKQYLTVECVAWLKKYVSYGRSALERTVAPEVSLLQKDPCSPAITCHVTGFYPRGIMVTWQRNGEDLHEDVELGETVPNEDGTFQTRSHLTVKPEDWKGQEYTCTVQHKSLEQDIVLPVKEENIKRNRDIKIAPKVSLLQKDSPSPGLTCHVTGFYPRGIMVTWQKDGEDLYEDVELGETVPNEDGTFQTTSNLTVKPEDWKSQKYTCTVKHKSLKQDIVLSIKNSSSPPLGIIIGCVVGALILILTVIGVVIWKKRSSGYGKTSSYEKSNIAPEVCLLQKDPCSPAITCHVTGFYPRGIMVTWQRNGDDLHEDMGETVPNEDGTFRTTSHLIVKPEDWKSQKYTCTVQHKSLEQDIVLSIKSE